LKKEAWQNNNLADYNGYDDDILKYILDEGEHEEAIDNNDWSLPYNATDKEFTKLIKRLKRTIFYEIVTVKE
jgi:hypothetical protein